MDNQTLYRLALTRIPGIGQAYAKKLLLRFGDAESIFRADRKAIASAGVPADAAAAILHPDLHSLHSECLQMTQKGIRVLAIGDPDYPRRLDRMPDPPPILFYQGTADLNTEKILAIIGTRRATTYGKEITQGLVRDLAEPGLLIISGLATGIDAAAHHAALQYHVPTVGILGHGLDMIYPVEHWGLSRSMRHQGGLLTSFKPEVKPEKHTFAVRNNIVAGLCDALIIVETGIEGGSHLTVRDAVKLKKKIFAVPGRLTDERSEGCLHLIREGKANLLISVKQLQADLGWHRSAEDSGTQSTLPFPTTASATDQPKTTPGHHTALTGHRSSLPDHHISLSGRRASLPDHHTALVDPNAEEELLHLLSQKDSLSIDELAMVSHLDAPSLAVTLLGLEISGKVRPLPGKRYRLNR